MTLGQLLADVENALTHPSALALSERAHDFDAKRSKALAALRTLKNRARAQHCPVCSSEKVDNICARCDL